MCGIAGFVGSSDNSLLKSMASSLLHRGPDDEGYYSDENVSLGFRRLSIIDVAGGRQPIFGCTEDVVIVFNGEIYNYTELRARLQKRGHAFKTNSDTETIAHCYEEYGESCVTQLRGMFAFAIWDSRKKTLFLARDRLGKKPLYYAKAGNRFLFASEIKALLRNAEVKRMVDKRALSDYLTLQYVPGPRTMFEGISKLQPGHALILENGQPRFWRYWSLDVTPLHDNERYCVSRTRELLKEAVQLRLQSEVPIGVLLSGGVDSSAVTAFMAQASPTPVHTFTVGFGDERDEYKYARIVADKFKTEHCELRIDANMAKALPEVVYHFDEPLADPAALPTFLAARRIKKAATVVLVGEGGDETFAGYEKYGIAMRMAALPPLLRGAAARSAAFVLPEKKGEFAKEISPYLNNEEETFARMSALGFTAEEKRSILNDGTEQSPFSTYFTDGTLFHKMLRFDQQVWLPDRLLMKVDKMTMASSLEARAPFMDHKLVEFANTLSPQLRLNKYILKRALVGTLPREILARKKQGFAVPIGRWLEGELMEIAAAAFEKPAITTYFKKDEAKKLLGSQKVRSDHKLWTLLNFELWHRTFIEGDGTKVVSL